MRLEAIDTPPTLKARIAAWLMNRQLGKVITPARVIYNRVPRMYDVGYALIKLQRGGLVLDPTTRFLITSWVAMVNKCNFCVDIARATALMEQIDLERLDALPDWRTNPLFDERQRAALAFAEEANRIARGLGRDLRARAQVLLGARDHRDRDPVCGRELLQPAQHPAPDRGRRALRDPAGTARDGLIQAR